MNRVSESLIKYLQNINLSECRLVKHELRLSKLTETFLHFPYTIMLKYLIHMIKELYTTL